MAKFKSFAVTETTERRKGRDYPVLVVSTATGETVRLVSSPKGNRITVS